MVLLVFPSVYINPSAYFYMKCGVGSAYYLGLWRLVGMCVLVS